MFAATRRNAEVLTEYIADAGWPCAFFHARDGARRRSARSSSSSSAMRCASSSRRTPSAWASTNRTSALVLHADIPGSLESYLQEAGRAGRDGDAARCVLLYDEEDVETQFGLAARSRLTQARLRRHPAGVAEPLAQAKERRDRRDRRRAAPRRGRAPDHRPGGGRRRDKGQDRRRAPSSAPASSLARRTQTRVFPASLQVQSTPRRRAVLERADLSDAIRKRYLDVLELVMSARAPRGISTDELLLKAGVPAEESFRILHNLEKLGLLANDLGLRVVPRKGVKDASNARSSARRRDRAGAGRADGPKRPRRRARRRGRRSSTLRPLCAGRAAAARGGLPARRADPGTLLELSAGDGAALRRRAEALHAAAPQGGRRRAAGPGHAAVGPDPRDHALRRRGGGGRPGARCSASSRASLQSADAIVECKAGELVAALCRRTSSSPPQLTDPAVALEQALLYLHDTEVLDPGQGAHGVPPGDDDPARPAARRRAAHEGGLRTARAALRRAHLPDPRDGRVRAAGARRIADALALVAAYFSWTRERFVAPTSPAAHELLEFATTAESYRRIVDALAASGAGPPRPGARHRQPVRARRARLGQDEGDRSPRRVSAAREARRARRASSSSLSTGPPRTRSAAAPRPGGDDARGVQVHTYHGWRCGSPGRVSASVGRGGRREARLRRADRPRGRLCAGGGWTGFDAGRAARPAARGLPLHPRRRVPGHRRAAVRTRPARQRAAPSNGRREEAQLMAVGDDDQNIYGFRTPSVEFIRRFQEDYEAETVYLVENYRSTQHIITAAEPADRRRAGPDEDRPPDPDQRRARRSRPAAAGSASTRSLAGRCSSSACRRIATSRRSSRCRRSSGCARSIRRGRLVAVRCPRAYARDARADPRLLRAGADPVPDRRARAPGSPP